MSAPLRVLLVGHGRMGRLVESLAPEYGDRGDGDRHERECRRAAAMAAGRRGDRFFDGRCSRLERARH